MSAPLHPRPAPARHGALRLFASSGPCRARWAERDRRWATALHRASAQPQVLLLLVACSRLGDGGPWIALMLALPLFGGNEGGLAALQMAAAGAINLALYLGLKRGIGRPRPFIDCPGIRCCTPPLDRGSFPSGHTLHAVAFTLILAAHYPALAVPLWAYAALVAASRVVLGLHYPSDVLAGAATGLLTAALALAWVGP